MALELDSEFGLELEFECEVGVDFDCVFVFEVLFGLT